jgi:hypothetical protein
MSSDIRLDLTSDGVAPSIEISSPSVSEVGSGLLELRGIGEKCRARTLKSKFYFRLGEFLRTGKEEESRSDNQEQEDIDGTGEVKNGDAKKSNRRRYVVVTELHTPCYGERKDDEGVCQGIT